MTTTEADLEEFAQRWMTGLGATQTTYDIMWDYDDVIMPWAAPVHEACRAKGLHDIETYTNWSMWEDYGCSQEQWLEVVDELVVEGGLYHTPPTEGVPELMRQLAWAGHRNHIVTARGFMAHADQIRQWTLDHVEEWAIPHTSLTFSKDKAQAMRGLGVHFDFAIDDGVHNFQALQEAGVRIYLLDQPHNQNVDEPFAPAGQRLHSVQQFVDIITAEALR